MAKNWALIIGINQYEFLQPLKYAKRDALLIQEFLGKEIGFEKIFFFSDDSPPVNSKSTRPNRSNIRRVLLELFAQTNPPKMGAGDNFWFFFSGHGMRHNDRDYLMPCDGNPIDIEETAIPINFVSEHLRRCGADNVVLILDACRNQGTRGEGIGRQAEEIARQTGIISIFSCSPNEYSYEIDALKQGAFTSALLEGLGIRGQCATVERLNQYLSFRVPELVLLHKSVRQTPYIIAEPVDRSHLILVPHYATLADIATLKNDAYRAKDEGDIDLAENLWIRTNAAASGQDMEAIKALQRIAQIRNSQNTLPPLTSTHPSSTVERGGKPKSSTPASASQPEIVQPLQIDDLSNDYASRSTKGNLNVDYTQRQNSSLEESGNKTAPTTTTNFLKRIFQFVKSSTQQQKFLVLSAVVVVVVFIQIVDRTLNQVVEKQPIASPSPTNSTALSKPSQPTSKQLADNLSSQKGVDYTRLRDLLAAKNWKDADYETNLVMRKIADRQNGDWIEDQDLLNFPCTDLRTIDSLWVKYSNGRFGFSVQKKIYLEVGGKSDGKHYKDAWEKFGDRVGWRVNQTWINPKQVNYNTTAPLGHLPSEPAMRIHGWVFSPAAGYSVFLIERLVNCNI